MLDNVSGIIGLFMWPVIFIIFNVITIIRDKKRNPSKRLHLTAQENLKALAFCTVAAPVLVMIFEWLFTLMTHGNAPAVWTNAWYWVISWCIGFAWYPVALSYYALGFNKWHSNTRTAIAANKN